MSHDTLSDFGAGIERGKIIERANSWAFQIGFVLGALAAALVIVAVAVLYQT